nr:vp1054 [Darna trima granulovirus]
MNCNETVTVRSNVVYQAISLTSNRKTCDLHPDRTNCILISHPKDRKVKHYTTLNVRYCSANGDPYYEWLLIPLLIDRKTDRFLNTSCVVCGVTYEEVSGDEVSSIDAAAETNFEVIRMVLRHVNAFINNVNGDLNGHSKNSQLSSSPKVYILLEQMYVDCLYTNRECIISPQELYCLYVEGEEPYINQKFKYKTVPENEDAIVSQQIYKSFLVYNTVLTMMLNEDNPFNDRTKVISKIIENVGTCSGQDENAKKTRIKVCDLRFKNKPPDHVMCPPKEMVKLIYKYSKWRLNPSKYSRYYTLLVNDKVKHQAYLREWAVFIGNFKSWINP